MKASACLCKRILWWKEEEERERGWLCLPLPHLCPLTISAFSLEPPSHTDTQTHRHTATQPHRHTDTQTHRHTDTRTLVFCVLCPTGNDRKADELSRQAAAAQPQTDDNVAREQAFKSFLSSVKGELYSLVMNVIVCLNPPPSIALLRSPPSCLMPFHNRPVNCSNGNGRNRWLRDTVSSLEQRTACHADASGFLQQPTAAAAAATAAVAWHDPASREFEQATRSVCESTASVQPCKGTAAAAGANAIATAHISTKQRPGNRPAAQERPFHLEHGHCRV